MPRHSTKRGFSSAAFCQFESMANLEHPDPTTPPASSAAAQTRLGDSEAAASSESPAGLSYVECDISPRAVRSAFAGAHEREPGDPLYRPLRIFALDPSVSRRDGSVTTINVPFEPLEPGPRSKLLEVVDEGGADESAGASKPKLNLD